MSIFPNLSKRSDDEDEEGGVTIGTDVNQRNNSDAYKDTGTNRDMSSACKNIHKIYRNLLLNILYAWFTFPIFLIFGHLEMLEERSDRYFLDPKVSTCLCFPRVIQFIGWSRSAQLVVLFHHANHARPCLGVGLTKKSTLLPTQW